MVFDIRKNWSLIVFGLVGYFVLGPQSTVKFCVLYIILDYFGFISKNRTFNCCICCCKIVVLVILLIGALIFFQATQVRTDHKYSFHWGQGENSWNTHFQQGGRQRGYTSRTFIGLSPFQDDLKTLGLSDPSTWEEVKEAYRHLALLHHPDKRTVDHFDPEQSKINSEKFVKETEAYHRLKDHFK